MAEGVMEISPRMMVEAEFMPEVEGELFSTLGAHVVTVGGQLLTGEEMIQQLFELSSMLPEMIANATMPSGKSFTHITPEQVETMDQIHTMLIEISSIPVSDSESHESATKPNELPLARPEAPKSSEPQVHRSLFSLARSMNAAMTTRQQEVSAQPQPMTAQVSTPQSITRHQKTESHLRVEEREGGGQGKNRDDDQQHKKKKKQELFRVKAANKKTVVIQRHANKEINESGSKEEPPEEKVSLGGVENIYIRFMALMARILGQAEAEAHQLYMKIKDRTDNVDALSLLMAKINAHKQKKIDWTNDPEMQKLVDKAREIGVEIPEGKYSWSEEELHLLKENIQMRKDSMEKITQLERTDMQRYLQEASQCHQARSNVLKLMKEVIDTIIHNMRT
ncbi:MAG: hypothetical protein H7A36_06890 [Chlamydiales bacterium]|nr:hypothetical protein [Chlamydiales bacterium]